jgi:hypothetical protein
MGKIETLDQLRTEIAFLKLKKAEDEIYLNQTFLKVNKAFSGPINFIKGALELLGLKSIKGNNETNASPNHTDWVTSLGRIALPFLLNKTILRGRGMFLKTAISLLSQTTINSKNFNKNVLASWIDKATYWINVSINSAKKKSVEKENDYGIPPDSETYSGKPVH